MTSLEPGFILPRSDLPFSAYFFNFQTSELTHELLEEQNVAAEVSEQLANETKEKLKLKEDLEFEKERATELEKVIFMRQYKRKV